MVATLLRLKLSILKNSAKRSTGQLIGLIIGAVCLLPMIPLLFVGAVAASTQVPDYREIAAVITLAIGAVVTVAWLIGPVVFFGSDETLDPRRFVTLGVPIRQLTTGLLLSSFIGFGGLFSVVVVLCLAVAYLMIPAAGIAGLVGGVLGVLMSVAASRLITTLASRALASRRGRDVLAALSVLVIVLASMSVSIISNLSLAIAGEDIGPVVRNVAGIVAWTPIGAPWALSGDAANGQWALLAGHALVSVVTLVLVVWLWSLALARTMVTSGKSTSSKVKSQNVIDRAVNRPWVKPANVPAVAVMARCLKYWHTDPRYVISMISVPLMPILFTIMSVTLNTTVADEQGSAGFPTQFALAAIPFVGWIVGLALNSDISSDSTAFWLHVQTGVAGRADRWGRSLAVLAWAVPMMVGLAVLQAILLDAIVWLPLVLGLGVGLLAIGLGTAMVSSAMVTYPVPLPGESPMATKSGSAGVKMLATMGQTLGVFVLAIPLIVLSVVALVVDPGWGWAVLVVGVVWGVVCLVLGVRYGGSSLDQRRLTLLAQLVKADS